MSIWQEKYDEFSNQWKTLFDIGTDFNLDKLNTPEQKEEFNRLKKLIKFIDTLLKQFNYNVIPNSILSSMTTDIENTIREFNNFLNCNYTLSYLIKSQETLSNVLNKLSPYLHTQKKYAKAAKESYDTYRLSIDKETEIINDFIKTLENMNAQTNDILDNIKNKERDINSIYNQYFIDGEYGKSVKNQIEEFKNNIIEIDVNTKELYKNLLVDEDNLSIYTKINQAKDNILKIKDEVISKHENFLKEVDELQKFYVRVIGEKDEDGKEISGLNFELKQRNLALDNFSQKQEEKYKALNNQINSLLPGATSAGLASAYQKQKDSYKVGIYCYNILFYFSILGLLGISFWLFKTLPSVQNGQFYSLLANSLYKIPFYIPFIWTALFSSKRRSELERLKQEYAHKEALAKSYESFKFQIEQLGGDSEVELLKKLLDTAISAVAKNASETLDKVPDNKTPILEISEKGMNTALDFAKNIISIKK